MASAQPAARAPLDSTPLRASAAVDVGAAYTHYDQFLPSSLVSASGLVRLETRNATLGARGAVARYESGHLNVQGAVAASTFSPPLRGMRAELAGSISAGYHETIGSSSAVQGIVRLHVGGLEHGAWIGGGLAWSALDEGLGAGVRQAEAGAWMRLDGVRAGLIVQPTLAEEHPLVDVTALARWTFARAELGTELGVRAGSLAAGTSDARVWGTVDAIVPVRDRLSVVASVGRTLADPITHAVGGSYATLGLRIETRGTRAEPPRVLLPRVTRPPRAPLGTDTPPGRDSAAASRAEVLTVEELDDGRVRLRLDLPGARSAELMGDFTDWQPVRLQRGSEGWWVLEVKLSAGVHRVNLRTNGGAWRAPPMLTAVPDGFGGEVGLLVVRK
ncbi:MAG TPA: glycogen-binding domain-containing protein [Gemmatimonadaceae bacterium]|nr:glycogen-binding domain-containing protein [Gemmatimonadaceae bacterium]